MEEKEALATIKKAIESKTNSWLFELLTTINYHLVEQNIKIKKLELAVQAFKDGKVVLRHTDGFEYIVSPKAKADYDEGFGVDVIRDGRDFCIASNANLPGHHIPASVEHPDLSLFTEYNDGDGSWYKKAANSKEEEERISVYDKSRDGWVGSVAVEAIHDNDDFYFEDGYWWYYGGRDSDR